MKWGGTVILCRQKVFFITSQLLKEILKYGFSESITSKLMDAGWAGS